MDRRMRWLWFVGLVVVMSGAAGGCVTIPSTPAFKPDDPASHSGFCRDLADGAKAAATRHRVVGWTTAVAGAGAIAVGSIIGPDPESGNVFGQNRGLLVSMAGLSLVPGSVHSFLRAEQASKTAITANDALQLYPSEDGGGAKKRQYDTCVAAKSGFIAGDTGYQHIERADRERQHRRVVDFQDRALEMQQEVLRRQAAALRRMGVPEAAADPAEVGVPAREKKPSGSTAEPTSEPRDDKDAQ